MNLKSFKRFLIFFLFGFLVVLSTASGEASQLKKEALQIEGLSQPVEIIKDRWGISHIFAQNQKDLFFAQGFNVAKDRLFQLEIWRRQATGTLAEILGPKALKRDIGSRLLKARVDLNQELLHYHPQGEEIIQSFVSGINAYIDRTRNNPELLPLEFQLLGIQPGHWTPSVVVSRHNGLFRNARDEVALAQLVSVMGTEKVRELLNLQPGNPKLSVPDGIDLSLISEEILSLYQASRSPVEFSPSDLVDSSLRAEMPPSDFQSPPAEPLWPEMAQGSNNWVISGRLTLSGHPLMANDPHRRLQIPSLRYWVHLSAPGWNVIGGGEPSLPGVSIGHNEYGAWGLTIFAVDQEDLYVYQTNPANSHQYRYQGKWEEMQVLRETIPVKGQAPVTVALKFTRHGPVLYEDREHERAYALRAAWLEKGGAPYLASLRMNQARTWSEFRQACSYSRTPSENMVWADVENNIGWQAVGITPVRPNWNGLLPVPGDGRFEWDGFLPAQELPHKSNPAEGYLASANQNNLPLDYPHSVGFIWTEPFRSARIQEVLGSGRQFTLTDMIQLQHDFLSIPARNLVPLLKGLDSKDAKTSTALALLLDWDYVMDADSPEATIYQSWQRRLTNHVWNLYLPEKVRRIFFRRSLKKTIDFLLAPDGHFGPNPTAGRDALLLKSLEEGISDLVKRLGPEPNNWQYGQTEFHHVKIHHPLSAAVNEPLRRKLDVGPVPQGGNLHTVNKTSSGALQTSGATFRLIADLENWDNSLGTNSPGQSGDPDSPHYADLFPLWAQGKYFPIFFTSDKIKSVAESITRLEPIKME